MNQQYKGKLTWQKRYAEAHYKHYCENYPSVVADELYTLPKFPKADSTNGLTMAILNFINWSGGLAERTGTEGRVITTKSVKTASGATIVGKSFRIKSSNKGATDISVTWRGRTIKIEVKNKATKDTFKKDGKQAEYRDKALRAGAIHYIATDIDSFMLWWDNTIAKMTLL
jgi:hypothetical protein